jgi:hypothetical protein
MPTALKARPHPRTRRQLPRATNDNRRIASLRVRPVEPELDDHPMVAVYAISSVLIVVGLFLLSV